MSVEELTGTLLDLEFFLEDFVETGVLYEGDRSAFDVVLV